MNSQEYYHPGIEDNSPQISLAAITKISQPQTLNIKGHIKNNNAIVLIDSSSTHNFVNVNLAKVFNLFINPVPNMKVMVAYGKKIDNVGKCHKVKLQMQEYNLESDFLAVPLGGIDVVLGIQWLQTLGTYSANHQEHFIEFHAFGKTHKLYGYQNTQIIWVPTTSNTTGYITSDGKATLEIYTNVHTSMSRNGDYNK